MNTPPIISVIIPVYNTEDYVERCLDSLVGQTYPHLEIILIDDGSTDRSGGICDRYAAADSRFKVVHKTNEGVSTARNTGLDIATGDFISFVDSDDYVDARCYEIIADVIRREKCDVVNFDYFTTHPTHETAHRTGEGLLGELSAEAALKMILTSVNPYLWTKVFARKCCESVRFLADIHWGEDSVFAFDAMERAEKIVGIPDNLYHYVLSENSACRSKSFNPRRMSGLTMANHFIGICRQRYPNLLPRACGRLINILSQLTYEVNTMPNGKEYASEVRKSCRKLLLDKELTAGITYKQKMKLSTIGYMPHIFVLIHRLVIRSSK